MTRDVTVTDGGEQLIEPPIIVRLWKEGKRIEEMRAYSIEYDDASIQIFAHDSEAEYDDGDFDELTIQYSP